MCASTPRRLYLAATYRFRACGSILLPAKCSDMPPVQVRAGPALHPFCHRTLISSRPMSQALLPGHAGDYRPHSGGCQASPRQCPHSMTLRSGPSSCLLSKFESVSCLFRAFDRNRERCLASPSGAPDVLQARRAGYGKSLALHDQLISSVIPLAHNSMPCEDLPHKFTCIELHKCRFARKSFELNLIAVTLSTLSHSPSLWFVL